MVKCLQVCSYQNVLLFSFLSFALALALALALA
jgi:hypothetical protein